MNASPTATAASVHQRRHGVLHVVLRLAAAVAIGFIGGTMGYLAIMTQMIEIRTPPPDSGIFITIRVIGFDAFCLASIYAACFGLLVRRASGRVTGAVVAWLATTCSGLMVAGIAEPLKRAGEWDLWAGVLGGLVAGAPVALYVLLSGLAERGDKSLGRSRFSLKALLWIVLGFAVLFAGLQLRGEYERRQHRASSPQPLATPARRR